MSGETANVDILVNAVTSAAEDSLDDVAEEIADLGLTAQTASEGVDEAGDELDDAASSAAKAGVAFERADGAAASLGVALSLVANRAGEAGDELREAGLSAAATSGLFTALTASTNGLNLSLGALGSTLTVALLPLLAALLSTLFPLAAVVGTAAAAAGGLAGAFGLIVGSGIVSSMTRVRQAFSEAADEIQGLLDTFGADFVPLVVRAIDLLPTLVANILGAIGGLSAFRDLLVDIGALAFDALPAVAAALLDLARGAIPVVRRGFRFLQTRGESAFGGMVETAQRVIPDIIRLGQAFVAAIPAITELGVVVLQTVIPALVGALRAFRDLAGSQGVTALTTGLAALQPLLSSFVSELGEHAIPAVNAALTVIGRLAEAFGSLPLGVQKAALAGFLALLGLLGGPITAVAAALGIMALAFDAVTAAVNGLSDAFGGFIDLLGSALISTLNFVIGQLNAVLTRVNQVLTGFDQIPGIDLPTFERIQRLEGGLTAQDIPASRRRTGRDQVQEVVARIEVAGDGSLAELIRDNVTAEADRRDRERTRRRRRQNPTGTSR